MATEKLEDKPIIKVVLIGDVQVGKTTIMNIVGETFISNYKITLQPTSITKETDKNILELWDTFGADSGSHAMSSTCTETDAFVFVLNGTKPLTEIRDHIKKQLKKAKENSPDAKFYIAVNQWPSTNQDIETAKTQIKDTLSNAGLSEDCPKALLEAPIRFLPQTDVKNVNNFSKTVNELFNEIEQDYINAPPIIQKKRPVPLAKKTSIPEQSSLPTHSKVWILGNLLFAAGGAALLGLSIASLVTGGILPAVIIGLSIALGVGIAALNIGYKIYDYYSKQPKYNIEHSFN